METTAIINHISDWLLNYAQNTHVKGFVIGISGGIDSAITSTLAAKTGLPLLCVEMPIHQNNKQVDRGLKHIDWLKENFENVRRVELELTPVFDRFISLLPLGEEKHELALVNTRARLRMTTLYYFAQANNSLVLGTGNKVEDFGIGFFTKYGDGGVDISPIADLLKTEVYTLGKELGIDTEILKAAPTDGLWGEDKTDEELDELAVRAEEERAVILEERHHMTRWFYQMNRKLQKYGFLSQPSFICVQIGPLLPSKKERNSSV